MLRRALSPPSVRRPEQLLNPIAAAFVTGQAPDTQPKGPSKTMPKPKPQLEQSPLFLPTVHIVQHLQRVNRHVEQQLQQAREEHQVEVEVYEDTINALIRKEREANDKLTESRKLAVAAANAGFSIPIRHIGQLDCESRAQQLPATVPVEGEFGRSRLQQIIFSDWHPTQVVNGQSQVNPEDACLRSIESVYPGTGVADFVLQCWQELQEFNASGGYAVAVPWNTADNREMTPGEIISLMMQGKPTRK